ncbi:hypothetical protein M5X17_27840 [Paenibacillus alvei]|uniref:hypothetical protein n=1 Tax=Paenibacillus alvei TaxID=44250 RepID=UPI00228158AE|nr:hypothetical protein [Paenibacillus alvei]MCY9737519.1 hypothetical protein [Paenibacillus alvei]
MKAYNVSYETGGKSTSMIVLAEGEEHIEEAVANKDKDYRLRNPWSKINYKHKVPLSNVLVSDLSVTELLMLQKASNSHEEVKPIRMEWEEFAETMERVSDLAKKEWDFQFLDSSIIVYHGEEIFRFCDNIEELVEFLVRYGGGLK